MPSRRSVAGPDRHALRTKRRSPRSGKGTPASIGIRQRISLRAPTACPFLTANRLLAVLNIAMADTAFTTWSAKRFYGSVPLEVTWRPVTSIPLADTDRNPDTVADPDWLPLINTPSHPEYPAGHPSLNGAAATVLLSHFPPRQTFTLTTAGQPSRTYTSILQARSDGNKARVWGGMHYPSTVQISDGIGQAIANYVNQNSMQRLLRSRHR